MTYLSKDEVLSLIKDYKNTNNIELRNKALLNFQALVRSIAFKWSNNNYEYEEYIQVGSLALLNALEKFNPNLNISFSTYATPYIIRDIQRYKYVIDSQIHLPEYLEENRKRIVREINKFNDTYARNPNNKELNNIIDNLNSKESTKKYLKFIPIEVNTNDNLNTLEGYSLEDEVINNLTKDELKRCIYNILSLYFNERETNYILLRYGFCGKVMEPREIKEKFNWDNTTFRTVQQQTLLKLKSNKVKNKIKKIID